MSFCPTCRQPTQPGATHCMHCRSPLAQPGYGAPPAAGGYGAPPAAGGYGAAPAPGGYGAAPAPGAYGPPGGSPGYGAPAGPPGFGPAAAGGFGPPGPQPGLGGPVGYGGPSPAPSTGMSGCGLAAIIGAVVAVLGGIALILLFVVIGASSSSDRTTSSPPPQSPPTTNDEPIRDDIPDTGALRALVRDRIGAYQLIGTGEVTRLGDALQGGVVDSMGARYRAPNGSEVTVFMLVYATEGIAAGKIDLVQAIAKTDSRNVVLRTSVLNKQRRIVGQRIRITGQNPQHVYWSNGKLLSFVSAAPPHAVGFEMAAPF